MTTVLLNGCDNSGGRGGADNSPLPPSPPSPSVAVPTASNVNIHMLFSKEQYVGNYTYSDDERRTEGHSPNGWYDSDGNVLVKGKILKLDANMDGKIVKYCVTPVTYDGVSGVLSCSTEQLLRWETTDLNLTTDWNTDNEIISGRNKNSGNIHFYENINIQPLGTSYSLKGNVSVIESSDIEHDYLSGFDFDDVYVYVKDGSVYFHNNTARTLNQPVIRVNDVDYYVLDNYIIKPFTNNKLDGMLETNIKNATFMDSTPAMKFNFFGFNTWNGPVSDEKYNLALQKSNPSQVYGRLGTAEYVIPS